MIFSGPEIMMSDDEFRLFRDFIYQHCGIYFDDQSKFLLERRLGKRLQYHRLGNFKDYYYLLRYNKVKDQELNEVINIITTNETYFFREDFQLKTFTDEILPEIKVRKEANGEEKKLRIWSAGCSTGEEPYTLAMVLAEIQAALPRFTFDILATDISTQVLRVAQRAVYPMRLIDPVKPHFRKKYLLKGKEKKNPQVRIVPELRSRVRFGRLNFMDDDFGLPERVDIIFCRNVIIYFDKETQEKLMLKFCRYLNKGGYLFLGHSESLYGYNTPLVQVAPTIYRNL